MVQCSLLQIFIESCHNLTSPDLSHPSPFVKLYVDKVKDAQVTRTKKNKVDPSYGTGFVFTVFNPKEDILHIRIIDTSTGNEPEIGFLDLALSEIIGKNYGLHHETRNSRFSFFSISRLSARNRGREIDFVNFLPNFC